MSTAEKKFMLTNKEVRLEPTNICNALCVMCPREKMKRPQGIMDLALYRKIIDQAVDAGATAVSLENYGETFLDPHIFDRAAYAKEKGMRTLTITNGSLLDSAICSGILDLFDVVRISMYGISKATYESIHKKLVYEKVRENIDRLIAMKKASPRSKTRIEMYFLLMDENRSEMKEWIDAFEKKVDAIAVWKPHNWGDGRCYRQPGETKKSCNRPFTGPLQVQWDGFVVPCCFDYDSRMVLGDLKKQTLHEVMGSEEFDRLREAHRTGNFSAFPFCDACDQLNKRTDVLVYTNIKEAKVGAVNTTYVDLKNK